MSNETILVTSATGLLGRALTESVPTGDRVIGVSRGVTLGYIDSALQFMQTNVTDQEAVNRLFDRFQFDVVVHAAGERSVDAVEKDPILGRQSIVQGAENLAIISKKHGARVISISTNAVFSGDEAPYTEASEMRPLSLYGQFKREAEIVFLESDHRC